MGEWQKVKLGDLIEIRHGFAFKGEFFRDEPPGDFLLTPGNFAIGGGFQWGKQKYYRDGPVPDDFVLSPGDILVTMTDLSKEADTLGYSAVVPNSPVRLLHNQRLGKIVLKSCALHKNYVHWLLRSPEYRNEVLASYTGSTVKHTSPKKILAYQFDLPPLHEQAAIAGILGALDDKIELNRRMNETLEAMARALFKDWFVDFGPTRAKMDGREPYLASDLWDLFPDRLDADGKPEGWSYSTVGERFDVKIGRTPPRKEGWHFTDGLTGVPWLSIRDLAHCGAYAHETSEGLTEQSVNSFGVPLVKENTVLVSFKLTVGRVAIAERAMATNEAIAHLNPNKESPSPYFTYCWMKEFDYTALGSTSSIATAVNSKTIKGMRFPDFCRQLENHFALFTKPIFEMLRKNSRESRALAQTRDLLLPKLMSGEICLLETDNCAGGSG